MKCISMFNILKGKESDLLSLSLSLLVLDERMDLSVESGYRHTNELAQDPCSHTYKLWHNPVEGIQFSWPDGMPITRFDCIPSLLLITVHPYHIIVK